MAEYISIRPGFSVKASAIIAIEEKEEFETIVYTESNQFESNIPKQPLIQILESHFRSKDAEKSELTETLNVLRHSAQRFEG